MKGDKYRPRQKKHSGDEVRAKKFLGQHFLTDEGIARDIVDSCTGNLPRLLEIGPGMGVLTKHLVKKEGLDFCAIEIDHESVEYLNVHYPSLRVVEGDFLKIDLTTLFHDSFAIIGNFPYNISSQILFRLYDNRDMIPELVGMFQKEVAARVAAKPGNKSYGILSVLLSAFYDIEYLFTVHEHVFNPPPKVKSAVIRLVRNGVDKLDCDQELFEKIVKTGFNQRRKTMRNALKQLNLDTSTIPDNYLQARAEQLSVADYIHLTQIISSL